MLTTETRISETERPLVIICDDINLLIKALPTPRRVQRQWMWPPGHADKLLVTLLAIQCNFEIWRQQYIHRGPETIHDPPSPPTIPDFRPTSTISMMAMPLPFSGSDVPSTAELTQLSPQRRDPTPTMRLEMRLQPTALVQPPELPIPGSHGDERRDTQNTSKRSGRISRIFNKIKSRASLLV